MTELEAVWAQDRQKVVDRLVEGLDSGEFGIDDDNVLHGPAGFEIDLSTCPDDWDNFNGLTDSEIRVGHTTVKSGNLAAYGNIADGWEAYNAYVNESGGIGGREVVMIIKDDGYVAAQTIEFVDELIEGENIFSINTLGSPNTLATYDKINDECIPHPFVMTGHPAWGDPVVHPWTVGLHMSYATEAILWGGWIKANLADQLPVRVAGLVMDNDFGLAYEDGFANYAAANPDVVEEFVPIRHDPAAPTITNEITTISASDPDVFISMTAGNPCLLAIQEVEKSGLLEDLSVAFTPSVCGSIEAYMKPAGDAGDDWWIVGGGLKDHTDPNYSDEVFMKFINDQLSDRGLDPSISLLGSGYQYAWPFIETLKVADALPGGLSRTNMMLAVRGFAGSHPTFLDGIAFEVNGAEDGYFVEGSQFSQYDAERGAFDIVGNIIDLNGSSPNCSWNKDEGGCA